MKEILKAKAVDTEATETINVDATDPKLDGSVTDEPQNDEQMHLKHFQWPDAVKVYLKVSDDVGEVLGSKVLERQVKECCGKYADPKNEVKDPEKDLASVKELATRYALQINMVESGLTGTITKYRIRQGQLFLIMKDLVKATEGPKWIEWFKENFDGREFRSVQDYMRLAKVPGIIRYAVFGKERLLQILRQLSAVDKDTPDRVGSFIERNGIDFNPAEEVDAQELRIEADIAINHQKLVGAGITEITKEMVDVLVRNGREIETAHLRELKVAKDDNKDVVSRYQEILASDGRVKPDMTATRKAESFKKTTDRFIKGIESAIEDAEYRRQVSTEIISSLKEKIEQLERLIQPTT